MAIQQILRATLQGMNHDFCPGLNRYVRWMKQPVGWVVCGAVSSALVGFFVGHQGFYLMWAFLALLGLGVLWPWLSLKGVSCKLCFHQNRTQEKRSCTVILEVTNRWPVPTFGLMLQGNFLQQIVDEDDLVAVGLRSVPAWSVSRFEWDVTPEQRGQMPADLPRLTNGYPFGLYQAEKLVKVEGSTIVWPAITELEGTPELGGLQFNIDGLASDRAGNDGDTIGVRDYRHGDAIKSIQWIQTARCNRLIVRERQTISQMPIQVIVDLTADNHTGEGSQSTYENSIRLATSVCRKLHVHQSRVELICLGLPQQIRSQTCNRKGLNGLLDFLALLPQLEWLRSATSTKTARPPAIRAADQFVILIHTEAFRGSVKPNKLVQRFCIRDNGEQIHSGNFLNPLSNEIGSGKATVPFPQVFESDSEQVWVGGTRAVG